MALLKRCLTTVAAAAICFAVSHEAVAATAPVITYTASGTFASTPASGADTLKMAGEPFTVTITASSAAQPYKHGPNWAAYHRLTLTGSVHSGLLGPTPVNIASSEASIIQAYSPGQFDQFTMEAPVKVVGISLTIKAIILMPFGTITNQLLQPFIPVTLAPGNATVTYSDGSNVTVLPIEIGTLTATVPSGSNGAPHSGN